MIFTVYFTSNSAILCAIEKWGAHEYHTTTLCLMHMDSYLAPFMRR